MLKTAAATIAIAATLVAFQPTPAEARSRAGAVAVGVGAALVGAAILGSAYAASQPRSCWIERRPLVNRYGEYVGSRRVRVCN